jgi:hypothetical protein
MENKEPLIAKCCFGHLGGTLGNRLFERMLALGWIEPREDNPKHYTLTQYGVEELIKFGVDPYPKR